MTNASDRLPCDQRLRVCYVVSYFHPFASGAERQALAQGVELARRGHEVHVVTHAVAGYPVDDEVVDGVEIHRWVRSLQVGPLFGLSFVWGVIQALRRLRGRFDVIHTHQGLWEAVAVGLSRASLGVPTLVQSASSGRFGEAQELARTRGRGLLRRAILRNTAFAAISEEIEREWHALGVPSGRMIRLASGVDTDRFRPGPSAVETSLPTGPRVVFTGRLHPQKNLDVLIDAWPRVLSRQGQSAHLILIGRGGERERLEARVRALDLAEYVHFPGPIDDPAEHLRAADVFVLPSVAEGMSNSLLEAMASGLPCLASSIGGNSDLLSTRDVGRLVDSVAPEAWADAIVELLEDVEARRSLGAAARRRVEAEFSLHAVVDRYERLYRDMIDGVWPVHHATAQASGGRKTDRPAT